MDDEELELAAMDGALMQQTGRQTAHPMRENKRKEKQRAAPHAVTCFNLTDADYGSRRIRGGKV